MSGVHPQEVLEDVSQGFLDGFLIGVIREGDEEKNIGNFGKHGLSP